MRYDFSAWQRAEDRMQEDRLAAERYRLAKQAQAAGAGDGSSLRAFLNRLGKVFASVPAAPGTPGGSGRRQNGARRVKKPAILAGMVIVAVACGAGEAKAQAPSPAEQVRNLAQNVLGEDTVKFVRFADNGRTVLIRWESATYRPKAKLADTREILYAEAVLATAVVLSQMRDIVRIRFTMVQGTRMLATGVNHRGRGLSLVFGVELGGGTYTPPVAAETAPKAPGPGSSLAVR